MPKKKRPDSALDEQIKLLERTVQEAEDLAHRFHLTASAMRRQLDDLKSGGPPESTRKVTDWKKEVQSWKKKRSASTAR